MRRPPAVAKRCGRTGKTSYRDRKSASIVINSIAAKTEPSDHSIPVRAYRCEFCGKWHLTSQE